MSAQLCQHEMCLDGGADKGRGGEAELCAGGCSVVLQGNIPNILRSSAREPVDRACVLPVACPSISFSGEAGILDAFQDAL